MFEFVLLTILLLLRRPQDVFASKFNFTISQVRQCEPISISFSSDVGDKSIPMMLTILPLKSTPVFIPIPGVASNTSGVAVTFLPLREGEEFIASLDDAGGRSISKVSDLTRVLPSLNGNSSCLAPTGASLIATDTFKLASVPTQCEQVSLTYNTAAVPTAPNVRVFEPKGKSFLLQQILDDPTNGNATYLVNVTHGNQVLFMFDDGRQHRQTTDLITVAGDSSSSVECLSATSMEPSASPTSQSTDGSGSKPAPISRAVIIGCSAGGGVIIIVALAMVIFVLRDRKRRKRRTITSFFTERFQGASLRNPFDGSPMAETGDPPSGGFITNPPYVMEELNRDGGGPSLVRDSFSSWTHEEVDSAGNMLRRRSSPDPLAIQTLDIEGMLNMANPLSVKHIINQAMGSDSHPGESNQPRSPQSALAQINAEESRIFHRHAPLDVPADPTGSGTFSGYSVVMPNPFTDENNIVIPSPLIQGLDESARPASDIIHPMSLERTDANGIHSNSEGTYQGGQEGRSSVQGAREETGRGNGETEPDGNEPI